MLHKIRKKVNFKNKNKNKTITKENNPKYQRNCHKIHRKCEIANY